MGGVEAQDCGPMGGGKARGWRHTRWAHGLCGGRLASPGQEGDHKRVSGDKGVASGQVWEYVGRWLLPTPLRMQRRDPRKVL